MAPQAKAEWEQKDQQQPQQQVDAVDDTPLAKAVRSTQACILTPLCFFVSWQGVLTVAYGGFPPALEALKATLGTLHPLPAENPGARWPKTSLGCLRDGTRLNPEQLATLVDICKRCSEPFEDPRSRMRNLVIGSACVVLYECRSLERCVARQSLELCGDIDERPPSAEQAAYVRGVVAECDAPGYWVQASRDGNREGHYRGGALGATLVHWLGGRQDGAMQALLHAARELRRRVDDALPGMYAWFDDDSLHVTLRNLKD